MRIFVVGTGRCGTVTFHHACMHIDNFISGHESFSKQLFENDFVIPDGRIEVDPHFAHFLPVLIKKYPEAKWVHLVRERIKCVESIAKTNGLKHYVKLVSMNNDVSMIKAAGMFYDVVNANISKWMMDCNHIEMHLENLTNEWDGFWNWIGAKGNFKSSVEQLSINYNNSKQKYGR